MAVDPPILTSNRYLDKDKNPLAADKTSISITREQNFIVSVQIDEEKGPYIASWGLRWCDNTDLQPFTNLSSTGEMKWGTDTALTNGNASSQLCTNIPAGSTWQAGKEVEGAFSCSSFELADEYYTEIQWAVNPADAQIGHVYLFELYNVTLGGSLTSLTGSVTIISASPTVVLNTPDDEETVGSTPTLNFTGTDFESEDIEYNVEIDANESFDSVGLVTIDSYSDTNLSAWYAMQYTTQIHGQSFTGNGKYAVRAKAYLKKTGAPTGTITAHIYSHVGAYGSTGVGEVLLGSSESVQASVVTTDGGWVEFIFLSDSQVFLSNGGYYCLMLSFTGVDTSNYVQWGVDTSTPTHSGCYLVRTGTSWTADSTKDRIFIVYSGTPLLTKYSDIEDPGFTSGHPFDSGTAIEYTVQSGDYLDDGTYYWRVRGKDPSGSNNYGEWSSSRSFTVSGVEYSSGSGYQTSYKVGAVSQEQPVLSYGYQTSYGVGDAYPVGIIPVDGDGYQTSYKTGDVDWTTPVDGIGYQTSYGEGSASGPTLSEGYGYQTSYSDGEVAQICPVDGGGYQTSYHLSVISYTCPVDGDGYQISYHQDLLYVRYEELEDVKGIPFNDKYDAVVLTEKFSTTEVYDRYGVVEETKYGVSVFGDKTAAREFEDKHLAAIGVEKHWADLFSDEYSIIVNE